MKTPALVAALTLVTGGGIAVAEGTHKKSEVPGAPAPTAQVQHQYVEDVDLFFDTDSDVVNVTTGAELAELAKWGRCNPNGAIILQGHADERGADAHNVDLSARRAAAVRDELISMGVPKQRIVIEAYGSFAPSRGSLEKDRRVTASVEPMGVTASDDDLSG